MREFAWFFLLLVTASPLFAAGGVHAVYAGGSVASLNPGTSGALDFTSTIVLRFTAGGSTFDIPYRGIQSFEQSNEPAFHLGVAPAIAVGLVAPRRRSHFLRIDFNDSNGVAQVAVFRVSKSMHLYLIPLLEARAPHAQCVPFINCAPR